MAGAQVVQLTCSDITGGGTEQEIKPELLTHTKITHDLEYNIIQPVLYVKPVSKRVL